MHWMWPRREGRHGACVGQEHTCGRGGRDGMGRVWDRSTHACMDEHAGMHGSAHRCAWACMVRAGRTCGRACGCGCMAWSTRAAAHKSGGHSQCVKLFGNDTPGPRPGSGPRYGCGACPCRARRAVRPCCRRRRR
eukprot:366345-Chlamydomonas_euryale.AAC.18